jgi:hypothetical protein
VAKEVKEERDWNAKEREGRLNRYNEHAVEEADVKLPAGVRHSALATHAVSGSCQLEL